MSMDPSGQPPESIPDAEFAFPGSLRDRLVAAIIAGIKTATTTLFDEYELENEAVPSRGQLSRVVDSDGHAVATIMVTSVDTLRLGDVSLEHVIAEGEGHTTVAQWRLDHEEFWHSPEYRAYRGDAQFTVTDDTLVCLERFEVVTLAPESQPE